MQVVASDASAADVRATLALWQPIGCIADLRFREATGRSIRDEIHALRMERAFSLLRDPRQAIGPIPNLCGYASVPFFKRLFKKTTGLTMREWRKRQTAEPPAVTARRAG